MHHYDRRDGAVGGADGDRAEIGPDCKADERHTTLHQLSFPRIPKGHPAREYIATNLIANVLGRWMGVHAAGLKAMEELAKLEEERGTPGYALAGEGIFSDGKKKGNKAGKSAVELPVAANGKSGRVASNEMCTFLILNISSLQLIPVNMIAYRQQYGSVNPAGIIGPAIVATFVSTLTAVVYCKGKGRKRRA